MKLLKVSVPNFRNLQNIELTFEPDCDRYNNAVALSAKPDRSPLDRVI